MNYGLAPEQDWRSPRERGGRESRDRETVRQRSMRWIRERTEGLSPAPLHRPQRGLGASWVRREEGYTARKAGEEVHRILTRRPAHCQTRLTSGEMRVLENICTQFTCCRAVGLTSAT